VDTGQQNKQSEEENSKTTDNKRPTCAYCKKIGHTLEESYKKKNSYARKGHQNNNNNQQSTSVNGKEPGKAGVRLVRELGMMTQN